jgi:hypothetical protein
MGRCYFNAGVRALPGVQLGLSDLFVHSADPYRLSIVVIVRVKAPTGPCRKTPLRQTK